MYPVRLMEKRGLQGGRLRGRSFRVRGRLSELVPQGDDLVTAFHDQRIVGDVDDPGPNLAGMVFDTGQHVVGSTPVKVCCDLIEHVQLGGAQEGPCQGKPLLHAAGKLIGLFADHAIQRLLRVCADHRIPVVAPYKMHAPQRLDQLFVGDRAVQTVQQVLADCSCNEEGDLRGVVEHIRELLLGIQALVLAEQGDLALGVGIIAVQTTDQAGLAASVGALKGNLPPGRDRDIIVPGKGLVLLGIGHDQVGQMDLGAGGFLSGGGNIEHGIFLAGCDFQQGLRLDHRGGGFVHETVHLVNGLDELLEQQADGDDRTGGHLSGGDHGHRCHQQDDLEGDLAELFQAVKGPHVAVVLLFGPADRADAGQQPVAFVILRVHGADEFKIGDGLADLAVKGVLLAHDALPDAILRMDLENRDENGQDQIQGHDPSHDHRGVQKHLDEGTDGGQSGGKDVVAQDLDQLAEPCHALVQLCGLLSAQTSGVKSNRHPQKLGNAGLAQFGFMGGDHTVQHDPAHDGDTFGRKVDQTEGGDSGSPLRNGGDCAVGNVRVQIAQLDRPDGREDRTDGCQENDTGTFPFGLLAHKRQVLLHGTYSFESCL